MSNTKKKLKDYVKGLAEADSLDEIAFYGVDVTRDTSVRIPSELFRMLVGSSVEFQKSATHILWRAVGTGTWNQLISLAEIKGDTGPYIEMRKTDLYIQWRVYGTLGWTNLVSIADLMGNAITSESINTIKVLTQEEFDLIGQKDNKTLYIVKQ